MCLMLVFKRILFQKNIVSGGALDQGFFLSLDEAGVMLDYSCLCVVGEVP